VDEPLLKDWSGWLEAGALTAGWLEINGAGLFACENSTQPVRKLKTDANVIHRRILFLTIFMFATFLVDQWVNSTLVIWIYDNISETLMRPGEGKYCRSDQF
jgi:mannose/fructose/N-acetylgalactosamine-specific phosphotransferase system component IID